MRPNGSAPLSTTSCWDYEELPDWLLGTDRCIELSDYSSRRTRIRNFESFYGPLAPLVWLHRGTHVQRGFEAFNRDLGCLLAPQTCSGAQNTE